MYTRLPIFQRDGSSAYKKDLANTLTLMQSLGNPERAFKSVHIAGTNGKGSISILLSEVYRKNGYKIGLYTSPHLKDFRERIRVNGKKIPKEAVVSFVQSHAEHWQKIGASFFEITVAMAFDYFRDQQVDLAIIEVGMGGRLDSTNVILPELSIISKIGMDHQQFLGDTIEEIAQEKAGIIKPGVPVVLGKNIESVEQVIITQANELKSKVMLADNNASFKLPIPDYQNENLNTVITAIKELKAQGWDLDHKKVNKAIRNTFEKGKIKGRWQVLKKSPLTIADCAHNRDGIYELVNEIEKLKFEQLHIVFGTVKDKDPEYILKLLPQNAKYYFCKADIPRGFDASELSKLARDQGLNGNPFKSVKKALKQAKKNAKENDLIIITGSIFVIAEVI